MKDKNRMKIISSFEPIILTELIPLLINENYDVAATKIDSLVDQLRAEIPESKRISYGRVHVIRELSKYLYEYFLSNPDALFKSGAVLYEHGSGYQSQSVGLALISYYGLADFENVLPFFEKAAANDYWDVREMAQMFFRKLIKKYPQKAQTFLLQLVKSPEENIRRFVSETLRPVQENQWIYKQPEYSLLVLRRLFKEAAVYPRTSVGNNLSDLARRLPELIYQIVEELVKSGDKNSYWIAYRACRNLVKKEPLKVMDLLGVDEYKYKNRKYTR